MTQAAAAPPAGTFFVALRDRGDNSVERVLHTLKKSNKKDFPEIQDFC